MDVHRILDTDSLLLGVIVLDQQQDDNGRMFFEFCLLMFLLKYIHLTRGRQTCPIELVEFAGTVFNIINKPRMMPKQSRGYTRGITTQQTTSVAAFLRVQQPPRQYFPYCDEQHYHKRSVTIPPRRVHHPWFSTGVSTWPSSSPLPYCCLSPWDWSYCPCTGPCRSCAESLGRTWYQQRKKCDRRTGRR